MKLRTFNVGVLACILLLSACKKKDECPPHTLTDSTINILPLGDSRVEGATPEFESYRYELWKNLIANDWDVDFIGDRVDLGEYAQVSGRCFDNEHEGTGGAVTADILETLNNTTFESTPEVVLLGIGGNDLLGEELTVTEIVANIRQIIGQLQAENPNVTIFVEQIAPGTDAFMTPEMTVTFERFNDSIPNVAASTSTGTSNVVSLNMAAGWSDSYMADDVHYNAAGAKVVADLYYDGIETHVDK